MPCHLPAIEVPSRLDQIVILTDWFAQFRDSLLPDQLLLEAQIGLVEAFTNAVRHAHRGLDPQVPVRVEVQIEPACFTLRVMDHGPPYDLEAALQARVELLATQAVDRLERDEHWGLILLLQLKTQRGWQLEYRCEPTGVNVFELCHALA